MITLSAEEISAAAEELYKAEKGRIQINALSERHPTMTLEDAYAVQSAWVGKKQAAGDRVIGYKIGLTSRVMQRAMQIDSPDFGVLLESMAFPTGAEIDTTDFTDPRIEVELAFVLKQRLFGEDLSVAEVIVATDYVMPALELIAARSYRKHPQSGYVRTITDTIADNAANAGIITGRKHMHPDQLDLPWCGAVLYRNQIIEETGLAAAVLGHPANGICWLAKRFAVHDIALEPGQILLSGSFTAPIAVSPGDTIHADFGSLGSVDCRFN